MKIIDLCCNKKVKQIFAVMAFAFSMQVASAASLDDVVEIIQELQKTVLNGFKASADMYLNLIYEGNPTYPSNVAGNLALTGLRQVIQDKLNELSLSQIKEALTHQNEEAKTQQLAGILTSDTYAPTATNAPASFGGGKKPQDVDQGNKVLYAGTFLYPLVYSNKNNPDVSPVSNAAAFSFIEFATGQGRAADINISALAADKRQLLETTTVGKQFKVDTRSRIAASSLAYDNLLTMFAKRVIIPGLGEKAGLPDKVKDASRLQVEDYLINKRNTTEWYQDMAKASPQTVALESLLVQKEILQHLYELQKTNERILATLSIMELQGIETNRLLDKDKLAQAKKLLGINY